VATGSTLALTSAVLTGMWGGRTDFYAVGAFNIYHYNGTWTEQAKTFNNNLPFLDPISGLQRSYRFPNPTAASTTDSRGYDNPPKSVLFLTIDKAKFRRPVVPGGTRALHQPERTTNERPSPRREEL
jgi:hypothetical protein